MTASSHNFSARLARIRNDPLVLPFYVPAFVLFLCMEFLTPVLPLYAEDFKVSYGWVGAVMSAQALGMLVSDVPCGLLLRRLGHKRSMIIGIALVTLMRIAPFWARSIQEVLIYRFISGFGMSLYDVARHVYITEQTDVHTRGRALALFGGLMRIAHFIGPPIGGVLAASFGLRLPFLIAGLLGMLPLLIVVMFTKDDSHALERQTGPAPEGRGWLDLVFRTRFRLLAPAGVGQIFAQMVRSGRGTIIPLYAAHVAGLNVEEIGVLLGIAAAVEMAVFIPSGWIMDNLGRKWAIVPSFALQAVGMALIPLTSNFGGLLACSSLIGFANGLSSGAMMVLGSDLAPAVARGEFLSVWRLIGDIGGTAGPSAVGFVADGIALPFAALTLAASGLLASLVFGFLLPETLRKPPAPMTAASDPTPQT